MKGDFSRDTFDPRRHYSAVRLQQGRVLTDADWNEQADITRHRAISLARDVIGDCGSPEAAAGFGLVPGTAARAIAVRGARLWVAGDDGVVLHSTDGGGTWALRETGETAHLHGIAFASDVAGWAVGDAGTILRSGDGGASWSSQHSPARVALFAVTAVDADRAWAVGDDGVVLRTTNGGTTWTESRLGAGRLYAVHFASASTGWAAGQDGRIHATTDGGLTWNEQQTGSDRPLRALAFTSATEGWAVGDDGTILRTTDAGATWVAQDANGSAALHAVAAVAPAEAWAGGESGVLLHTTDGGATWQDAGNVTDHTLRGAAAAGGAAWLAGAGSTLLRAGTGSPPLSVQPLPAVSLAITSGRLYVGGTMCEADGPASLYNQPDLRLAGRLPAGTHLVYADVWQRYISHLQDPGMREIALGGPDTAGRVRTVWQVRTLALPASSPADWNCLSDVPEWEQLIAPPAVRLRARAEPEQEAANLCEVGAAAGYRRIENQLYRVEVQQGGAEPLFKWSRENGSVAYRITDAAVDTVQDRTTLTLASRGEDENLDVAPGDWLEIVDEDDVLGPGAGQLLQFLAEGNDPLEIVLAGALAAPLDAARLPLVRRWEQQPEAGAAALSLQAGTWLHLEDGVQVLFEGTDWRPGDYWMIPARTISGDVDWPRDEHGGAVAVAPHGNSHSYCRLGIIGVSGSGEIEVLADCRTEFSPLTGLVQLLYASGDGQDGLPGRELPQPLRVRVVRGARPLAGRRVRFQLQGGNASLVGAGGASSIDAVTAADGTAECRVLLGGDLNPNQRHPCVTATLLDAASTAVPGQQVRFCATASVMLSHVSGDGQQGAAGALLPHPLEVRVSNGHQPLAGVPVHFTVASGGGQLGSPSPVPTDAQGVARVGWQLGGAGDQRVEAELRGAGGARVQYIGFNAAIRTEAAGGGCCISIGEGGEFSELTSDLLKLLAERYKNRVCICFRPGLHVVQDLSLGGDRELHVSLHGCGRASTLVLEGQVELAGLGSVTVSDLHIETRGAGFFHLVECGDATFDGVSVWPGSDGRPFLHVRSVETLEVRHCRVEGKGGVMAIVVDHAAREIRITDSDIAGVLSLHGEPDLAQRLNVDALLAAVERNRLQILPDGGRLILHNNTLGVVTIGRELMRRLNSLGETNDNVPLPLPAATVTGNRFLQQDGQVVVVSAALALSACEFDHPPVVVRGGGSTTVSGRVRDTAGGPVPGVQVLLRGEQGTASMGAVANADGAFRFSNVAPGRYTISASITGMGAAREVVEVGSAPVAVELRLGRTGTAASAATNPWVFLSTVAAATCNVSEAGKAAQVFVIAATRTREEAGNTVQIRP